MTAERSGRGLGARRVYLQVLDLADLDHIRLLGEQVGPALTAS